MIGSDYCVVVSFAIVAKFQALEALFRALGISFLNSFEILKVFCDLDKNSSCFLCFSGLLHQGDEIWEVNGISTDDLSLDGVVSLLVGI